jgi:hypothetical protein
VAEILDQNFAGGDGRFGDQSAHPSHGAAGYNERRVLSEGVPARAGERAIRVHAESISLRIGAGYRVAPLFAATTGATADAHGHRGELPLVRIPLLHNAIYVIGPCLADPYLAGLRCS